MANPVDQLDTENSGTEEQKKAPFSINFKGKRFALLIANALVSEAKFRTNQLANCVNTHKITSNKPKIHRVGRLDYFAGRDEGGLLRGGDLPWQYMQGLCDDKITSKEKYEHLCYTLAQLPSNMSYIFKADPNIRDQEIVRAAFRRAGFVNQTRTTLIYRGEPGQDPLDTVRAHARTKIHKAYREMEFWGMSADEFFAYYRKNLGNKESHFFLNIDHALLKQAVNSDRPQAEVIAVRRKDDGTGKPQPVEAAAIVSLGADGYSKLLRLSFRRAAEGDDGPPPHPQALKMLVVEAMRRATERGLPLDVDGFTPGGNTLYSRFGGFEPVVHDQFARLTPAAAISRLSHRVKEMSL